MMPWWNRLSVRERVLVGAVTCFVIIVLLVNYIWLPLHDSITASRDLIKSQQHLLLVMEQTQQKLERLKSQGLDVTLNSQQPTLSLTESTFSQYQLSQYIDSVKQDDTNTVSLTLKAVPFDKVMDCVQALWNHYTVQVRAMQVKKMDGRGLVNISLVFKK